MDDEYIKLNVNFWLFEQMWFGRVFIAKFTSIHYYLFQFSNKISSDISSSSGIPTTAAMVPSLDTAGSAKPATSPHVVATNLDFGKANFSTVNEVNGRKKKKLGRINCLKNSYCLFVYLLSSLSKILLFLILKN